MLSIKTLRRSQVTFLVSSICLVVFCLSVSHAQTKKVTLKNGKTYTVQTEDGEPVPFKSEDLEIEQLGGLVTADFAKGEQVLAWTLVAQLKKKGHFKVKVTSPIDEKISARFECNGPGLVIQSVFARKEYPQMWTWVEESDTSWIPFIFTFEDSSTHFEVLQWTRYDADAKKELRVMLQQIDEQLRKRGQK